MNALSSRLGESLDLYADVLLNPTFPENELERLRGQTLAAIQQEKAQPAAIISRIAPKLLFGEGHAYSNPASGTGTEEAVTSLKGAELAAFYQRWVRPDNSMLLVVGDTTLAAIQPLLEQRFGGWRAPAEPLPKKNIANVPLSPKPRVFLIDRPGRRAVADPRHHRRAGAFRCGSHPLRGAGHAARRQFHLAPQHESARGQALVLRRRHAHHRCRGAGHVPRRRRRADRQDRRIDGARSSRSCAK